MALRSSLKLFSRTGICCQSSPLWRLQDRRTLFTLRTNINKLGTCHQPWNLQSRSRTLFTTNILRTDINEDSKQQLGTIDGVPKLYLSFTCTVCSGSNSYTISKQAYSKGVVIVTCSTCTNNHLIADNLGWFEDVEGKNIEEIMEGKGEKVTKFIGSNIKEIIPT